MDAMRSLARFLVTCDGHAIPVSVRREAARALLDWLGCAIGACRHETVNRALAALGTFGRRAQASVLGRAERLDVLHAALINGTSSHVFCFAGRPLQTSNHPWASVAAAILALAEHRAVTGASLLEAFVLGIEAESRVAYAVHPSHHDFGWRIAGSAGVLGAAAACGRLLALDEQQMTWALGIAATEAGGSDETFAPAYQPFHPGRAARDGMAAALLAKRGFTPWGRSVQPKDRFAAVLPAARDVDVTTQALGERWTLAVTGEPPETRAVVILSDRDLDAKFCDRVEPHLGSGRTRRLLDVVRRVEDLGDAADIARATIPALHWGADVAPGACA